MFRFLEMFKNDEERLSFQKVYEKNCMKMYYAALNKAKNAHIAEDAVHEAFLKLAEKYPKYKTYSEDKMASLCIIMAKQKAVDMFRRDRKLTSYDIKYYENELKTEEKVIDSILLNEEKEILRNCVDKLTDTSTNILELKYYHELNNGEIADLLGISKKHVEVRLNRARVALRKSMEKYAE